MEERGERRRGIIRALFGVLVVAGVTQALAAVAFRRWRDRFAAGRRHFIVTQGGLDLKPTGDGIADGVVSVLMGGVVLDLRAVDLAERPARLDVLCIMGGVEILAPPEWHVEVDLHPVMGGAQDRRKGGVDESRPVDLLITGRVIMGGVDIAAGMPGR